ncbi:unnamed protein product [Candidula unifasciata]|uniref:Transcriptional repressor NF-X1 n=1 Tax=Candidula unifasciata TaxID=100452 RepID=A0A8S3Z2Q1_9EUPU|nr:unnamed protein product [Candidula unifasciata]
MSWQGYSPDMSSSSSIPVLHPGMNAADLENHQLFFYGQYPPPPVDTGEIPTEFLYTNSDYFPPAIPLDGFTEPYLQNTYPESAELKKSTYSSSSNFAYMPGMPVHPNQFSNSEFGLAGESSADNFVENQWTPKLAWSERGRYNQPYRARGKNKFQDRGRVYKNTHNYSYSDYNQGGYYDRDDYYYDTPHYDYYNHHHYDRRGGNIDTGQRGREEDVQDQFRLGDGDGKPHRKKNNRVWLDQQDVGANNGTTALTNHKAGKQGQSNRYSKTLINQAFDSRAVKGDDLPVSHITHVDYRKARDSANKHNESHKDLVSQVEEMIAGKSSKSSRSEGFLGNEINAELNRDQASYIRGRGHASVHNMKKISGTTSRSADTKKFKNGVQEWPENDESQRATLTEQLSSSKYECMVCCDNIRPESAVWSCQNCYHVFHLSCIQKWAQSSLCKETKSWRCPGCQNVSVNIPSQYRCFCGRRRDPNYKRGEIAHSCGETCRKKRKGGCKHTCTILCHPGPCPPCFAMVWLTCDCGKIRKNVRCSAAVSFKCDQICDKKLNCLDHNCQEVCHAGPCSPCLVYKMQECFCKKMTRKAMCGSEEFVQTSFSCEKPCGKELACGNHVCEELCHPGDCASCPLMPGNLKTCSCGKTTLTELDVPERHSCLDPVPTCKQMCNKAMSCGSPTNPHLCDKTCHAGECGPCSKETILKCLCGATEKKMPCEVAVTYDEQNPFKCQRRCGKKKNCGRHKCSDNCCIKDIHICEIVCGQKLSCGLHKCEELCHRGNCKRCLQASFEELTCYCGAEMIEPPVPCGTRPPECRQLCTRHHDCDHPVRHRCHMEDVCPPCTDLTDKMCMGGHMLRKNVPCHMANISCGYPCNKLLPCGEHKCQKVCHKGDCLEDGAVCTQLCEKIRLACGHPCGAPCHLGPCPDAACKTEITITCPCGQRAAKALCSIGGDHSAELAQFQRLSVQTIAESGGQSVDLSQFTQTKKSNKRLDCDTNCGIIERNRRLALALEIKNPDINAKLGNPTFTEFLKDYAKKNPKFALSVEKSLTDLVQSAKQSAQPNRSHAFQSMNREQRRFVHELAEFYGCQTQSYDYEPVKNVVATATKDKCWLPNVTLSQHALKDQLPKLPPPISTFKTQGVTFTVLEKKKTTGQDAPSTSRAWGDVAAASSTKQEPVVDYFDFTSN